MSSNVARFVIRLLVWLINIERRLPTLISQPYKLIWHYAFESNKFIFSLKNKPADYLMFGSGLRQLLFSRNYLCSLVRQLQTIMNRLFVLEVERACFFRARVELELLKSSPSRARASNFSSSSLVEPSFQAHIFSPYLQLYLHLSLKCIQILYF